MQIALTFVGVAAPAAASGLCPSLFLLIPPVPGALIRPNDRKRDVDVGVEGWC
jgi:hypothetical protein